MKSLQRKPLLIKLGGSALKDPALLQELCQDFVFLQAQGHPLVIVHGGGPAINEELTLRGYSWEFYQGQRITTNEMMMVIEMVLCGKVNRQIIHGLNQAGRELGIKAVGHSGVDSHLLLCQRAEQILGRVGLVNKVDKDLLTLYLQNLSGQSYPLIPVMAPIGVDEVSGESLNINADWAASAIASALEVSKLIYLTDQEGVLDQEGKVIPQLTKKGLEELIKSGVATGGMLVKLRTILSALENNVSEVLVMKASHFKDLLQGQLQGKWSCVLGTTCKLKQLKQREIMERGVGHEQVHDQIKNIPSYNR